MGGVDIRRSSAARCVTWWSPGRPVADVAKALGISDQTIYAGRRLRAESCAADEILEAAADDACRPQRPVCASVAGSQVMVRRTRTNR